MAYRSTEKTRQKKDSKRTEMMQAALHIFAEKGYHAATVRDVVKRAGVAVGTFYFYFPDKETLFVHLYEETAEFLLQSIQQTIKPSLTFPQQVSSGLSAYLNIAIYEPAVIQLLLVGGVGAVPSLKQKYDVFRQKMIGIWQKAIEQGTMAGTILEINSLRVAQGLAGAFDEVVLHLIAQPAPEDEAEKAIAEMTQFAIGAAGYKLLSAS